MAFWARRCRFWIEDSLSRGFRNRASAFFHQDIRKGEKPTESNLQVTCPDMEDGGRFPLRYTGRGEDLSPELVLWKLVPEAVALAVILEDQSHLIPHFPHWLIWNLPAAERIPGGIPHGAEVPGMDGVRQGMAYGLHRYAGPKPPKGKRHAYCFTVYALDTKLSLGPGAGRRALLKAMSGHVLQRGSITGVFA